MLDFHHFLQYSSLRLSPSTCLICGGNNSAGWAPPREHFKSKQGGETLTGGPVLSTPPTTHPSFLGVTIAFPLSILILPPCTFSGKDERGGEKSGKGTYFHLLATKAHFEQQGAEMTPKEPVPDAELFSNLALKLLLHKQTNSTT